MLNTEMFYSCYDGFILHEMSFDFNLSLLLTFNHTSKLLLLFLMSQALVRISD